MGALMGRIVIDRIMRGPRPLSDEEQRFADWVETGAGDLVALFSTIYPQDDDPEPFEPFDTASLCVEERMEDGRIAAFGIDVYPDKPFPELWAHIEQLARMGLERVKETA